MNAGRWILEGNRTKHGGEHQADLRSPKSKEDVARREESARKKIGGCVSKVRLDNETGL